MSLFEETLLTNSFETIVQKETISTLYRGPQYISNHEIHKETTDCPPIVP